ncbi:MAG: hypothetical protein FJZ59_05270 [Chlamydiae bacterium]|nr:hypothetical protein [Chlamydiota bacterium]
MRFLKKKYLVGLTVFLFFLAGGFFFRNEIFQFGIESFLNAKIPGKGWQFRYERVVVKKGQVSFCNISLTTKKPFVSCDIEKVDLHIKHRKGFHFDIGLRVQAPYLSVKAGGKEKFFSLDHLFSSFPRVRIDIDDAEVVFLGNEEPIRVYCSLVSDELRRSLGTFCFSDKPLGKENEGVLVKLYDWPQESIFEFEFSKVSFSWMNCLIKIFQIDKSYDWNITRGLLDGHLWLAVLKDGSVSQAHLNLKIHDVEGIHEENGIYTNLDSLFLDASYPSGKKGEVFWQNFTLKLDVKGGEIECRDEKTNVDFAVRDLSGHINFHSLKDSEILLNGYLDHKNEITPIVLNANPSPIDKETLDVNLKLSDSNFSTRLNLSIAREGEDLCVVRGRLSEMDASELIMLQHAFGFFSPEIKELQLIKGKLTSEISLRVLKGKIEKVLLDGILADDIEVYFKERNLFIKCAHLSGSATLDLQNLFSFDLPNWELNVQNGEFLLNGDYPIHIQGISMQLYLCRKVFEPSWIRATYGGIDILLDVVGYYSEADLNMHLSLTGDKILELLCTNREDFSKFSQHKIHTDIEFHRQLGYWEVSGKSFLNVIDDWEDSVRFGFFLSDQIFKEGLWRNRIRDSIAKGWIETDAISLEFMKLITVYANVDWLLEGMGELKANFNGEFFEGKVNFSHANFFSPKIDVCLHRPDNFAEIKKSECHLFCDFTANDWRVRLPFYEAVIHEKEGDLFFNDTKGELFISENCLKLASFVTETEGLILGGDLEFCNSFVKVKIDSLVGTVKQVENVLHHFKGISDFHAPFEGVIRTKEGGINLVYHPEKEIEMDVHVELVHGLWEIFPFLQVHELSFDFDFCSIEERAFLTNVLGKIPSIYQEGGYFLNGKEIVIEMGDHPYVEFDVRLENQVMDLIRSVGRYEFNNNQFKIDTKQSHLFTVHPNYVGLSLDKNFVPKEFAFSIDIPFSELANYGKIFADLKFFDESLMEVCNEIYHVEGGLQTKISLQEGVWDFDLATNEFGCSAKKQNEKWQIEKLHIGPFSISGELTNFLSGYKISNLQGKSFASEFIFEEGFLDLEKKRMRLPIQFANLDFKECISNSFEGKAFLKGVIEVDYTKGFLNSLVEAKISSQVEKNGYELKSLSDFYLIYSASESIAIKEGSFSLSSNDLKTVIDIPFGSYSFTDEIWQGLGIKTCATNQELEWILKTANIEGEVPKNTKGVTEAFFDVEFSKGQFSISGVFGEGKYSWKGEEVFIHQAKCSYDKNRVDFEVTLPLLGSELNLHARVYPGDARSMIIEGFEKGVEGRVLYAECLLIDEVDDSINSFSNSLKRSCHIQKMQGNLFGLDFEFLPINKMEDFLFIGDIKIDADLLAKALGPDVKELVEELKFHKGYELKGELQINKDNLKESYFEGYLKGRDFDFAGYLLKTLLSEIRIDQKGATLKDLLISDEGVTVSIPELVIEASQKGDLSLHIKEIEINELRPSLLKKKHTHQRLKPFCIKTMVFQDVSGYLADTKTFTGRGSLTFNNTFKEGHNLLDIPIEIISRLGLDIGLLVPIQGEIDYVIKNGKIVFTKLKNSFSESKRSYFYLWNKTESYLDFDGNMHIDIRMKQYVLFKITELFILSIQGSLDKPKCFLR